MILVDQILNFKYGSISYLNYPGNCGCFIVEGRRPPHEKYIQKVVHWTQLLYGLRRPLKLLLSPRTLICLWPVVMWDDSKLDTFKILSLPVERIGRRKSGEGGEMSWALVPGRWQGPESYRLGNEIVSGTWGNALFCWTSHGQWEKWVRALFPWGNSPSSDSMGGGLLRFIPLVWTVPAKVWRRRYSIKSIPLHSFVYSPL